MKNSLVCALVLAAVIQSPASAVPLDAARMDEVVQSYTDSGKFMGAVLVARDGQALLDKGYGYANLEWQVANTPDTRFRLGSLTKQFTAATILLLQERGQLRLSDPVRTYLPDAPAAWDGITVQSLLNQTSGIPEYTDQPDFPMTLPLAPDRLMATFASKPLRFQPGTQWAYSNANYVVLGRIIEKVSGQTYAAFIQKNIFDPLGMKDSGYDAPGPLLAHRAAGYTPGKGGPRNADYVDMSLPYAAGGLYSTTHDLLAWEQALFGGKLLAPASLKAMTTPFKADYGLGVAITTVDGHTQVQHAGAIQGFSTDMAYFPDEHLAIIVLGNLNGDAPSAIRGQIAAVAHGQKVVLVTDHKEVPIRPELLDDYVGTYVLTIGATIVITKENGRLMAQMSGGKTVRIFPESDTVFFLKVADAQIEFGKDAKGARYLILHRGGQAIKGVRK